MKVSIITVCYNSEDTIEDTIRSVQMQNYHDIEYIIIDGASSDSTISIINRYSNVVSLFVSEKDNGLYDAINKGISLATGEIIGMLNSDDVFYDEDSISNIVGSFTGSVDGIYADLVYVKRDNLDVVTRIFRSSYFKPSLIKFGLSLPHPTFYIRKTVYDKLGLYDVRFKIASDFELMSRVIVSGANLFYLPKFLVKMREGGLSTGSFKSRLYQNKEIVNGCRLNGIKTNIFCVSLKIPYKIYTILVAYLKKI